MDNVILNCHGYTDSTIQSVLRKYTMPEEKEPRWVTLGEAAEHVEVTRETLRRMIKRDKDGIPDACWRTVKVGKREFYQVDLNCLEDIEFNSPGRQPKSNRKNL